MMPIVLRPFGMVLKVMAFVWTVACFSPAIWADSASERNEPRIEGYTNQLSYLGGEEVAFHLSSNAGLASVRIERVGPSNQLVLEQAEIQVSEQSVPDRASSDGCNWPATWRFKLPEQWSSGLYEATWTIRPVSAEAPSGSTKIHFIVRSSKPGESSKILLQLSTNTWNAYTNWGGHSLYSFHDRDGLQGHRVSFNRPQASGQFYNWESHFVRWAESNGYQLDYAANSDLEFHPEVLAHYRLVLSVGHDEYWSSPMRDQLEAFIRNGGNVAFFSGNTCCWQVRSEEQGRALTCWKQAHVFDPLFRNGDQRLLSTLWSHHLVGRPENQLTGVGFLWGGYHRSHGQLMDADGAYEVHRPEHWIFEGTQLLRGQKFGGAHTIVGYECDGCELQWRDGLPFPTGGDGTPAEFEVLATAPAKWAPDDSWWYEQFPKDREGNAVLGVYTRGGIVFTCGSTDWAHGLSGNDPVVVRITRNILDRLAR
ncbi:MAG: N,N-dimethylformamidase beta subunit family domain-containing protein [Planctomycetota bacterium]